MMLVALAAFQDETLRFRSFDSHLGDVKDLALLGLCFLANLFVLLYAVLSKVAPAQRTGY